jgi:PTH1 family peptidyl-tRNA hydrolase
VKLIVGLGNPGAQYAGHRHNVGFWAVEQLAGSGWSRETRFKADIVKVLIAGGDRWLMKPATFMNESGRSVAEAVRFYKRDPAEALTVFYDELDLAPFKLKIKHGGGAAGHNGIRSIDAHLGPDWRRVRIGVGHPGHKDRVTGHVLGNFAKVEMDPLADLLGVLAAELPTLLAGDELRYLSDIALRLQP